MCAVRLPKEVASNRTLLNYKSSIDCIFRCVMEVEAGSRGVLQKMGCKMCMGFCPAEKNSRLASMEV